MALQKQAIDITLGDGVSEGMGDRILQPPKLGGLEDARFNKRGEVEKRFGSASTTTAGLTSGQVGQALWAHGETLVQNGSEGPHALDELESRWKRTNVAGPRPCELRSDPMARGNGSYQHGSIAYSAADDVVCIAYEDFSEYAVRVSFYNATTGELLRDQRINQSTMNERPRCVFFNSTFCVFAIDRSNDDISGVEYDSSVGDYVFGMPVVVHSGGASDESFDVHVAGPLETTCHLAVAKSTVGWVCYEIDSLLATSNTLTANTGRNLLTIAVFHNEAAGNVAILYPDTATSPAQLSIDVFAEDYLSSPTKTKVLDYEDVNGAAYRRVSLGLADSSGASTALFCVSSHWFCDGDEHGGLDYITTDSAGTPGTDQGFSPTLVLCQGVQNDSLGRAVFGATRFVDWTVTGSLPEREPSPCCFLLTPSVYTASDVAFDGQGTQTTSVETTVYGLAQLARYGHDVAYCALRTNNAATNIANSQHVAPQVLVGTELWSSYAILAESNPGYSELHGNGWRFALDLYRADCDPKGQQTTDVEGVRVVAGGVAASFDGRRLVESACPVVPHEIRTASKSVDSDGAAVAGGIQENAIGGTNTNYAITTGGMILGSNQYVTAFASFKYLFRWEDHAGNVHRSSLSPVQEYEFMGSVSVSPGAVNRVPLLGGNKTFLFPRPSFTSLSGEHGVRWQVELYRTGMRYERWDAATVGSDTSLETNTPTDATTYRLVAIERIGDVTDHPNLGYIEDPTAGQDLYDGGSPLPYDTGGELASEPCPAALDVASTQRRVFMINAEDRLQLWYSKPLIAGLAHEWNGNLTMRVSAEGGELVALASMDDKLVAFKRDRVYVTAVTTGPTATGSGTQFMPPREVASDTGCVNQRSVVSGPFGVAFESDRGIYLLGRDLGLQFLGEPVTGTLDGRTIHGVVVLPTENEVRWTLDNGDSIHWNYLKRQWAVGKEMPGQAATRWRNRHARLLTDGNVEYDLEGTYSALVDPPLLSLTTAWIKLAGLQGFQRIWRVLFLADHVSGSHTIEVGYDYESAWTDTHSFTAAQLAALTDPTQLRIIPSRQKCQSIRFRIRETNGDGDARTLTSGPDRTLTDGSTRTLTDGASVGTYAQGMVLQGIRLVVGLRRGGFKHLGADAKR